MVESERERNSRFSGVLQLCRPGPTSPRAVGGPAGGAIRVRTGSEGDQDRGAGKRRWWPMLVWMGILCGFAGALPAQEYVVRPGDTLSGIAQRHGVSLAELAKVNELALDAVIRPGQRLRLPEGAADRGRSEPPRTVVVRKNENLTLIARAHGVDVRDLAYANGLTLDSVIHPGQRLVIPSGPVAAPRAPLPARVQKALDLAPVPPGRWRYIVIHHSATAEGNPRSLDRYHREVRRMENGLAYHFVIGNGHGMGDGEIAVGHRWTRQLPGGHLGSESLNQQSIGICLVGDFNRNRPTRRQMESLEALVRALMQRCGLPREAVTTHQRIQPGRTECPGRHFPWKSFLQTLDT